MNRESAERISSAQFLLLLHSVPYLGEKRLTRLLRHVAQRRLSPEACLALPVEGWQQAFDLDARSAAYLVEHRDALLAHSTALARALRAHPLQILSLEHATYPRRLERHDDAPPPLIYALGNLALLETVYSIPSIPELRFPFTIALSNEASPDSLARLDEIAQGLVEAGGVPVTGHDRNPYQRLALAAQRRHWPTLYVFDRGLREALGSDFDRPPFAAARIRETVFDTKRDLAVSPFRLDDHAIGANNRRRDRMLFALSDVIVALDVRGGGGMEAECLRAHAQGRPVWVAAGGREGNARLRDAGCRELPATMDWAAQLAEREQSSGSRR